MNCIKYKGDTQNYILKNYSFPSFKNLLEDRVILVKVISKNIYQTQNFF